MNSFRNREASILTLLMLGTTVCLYTGCVDSGTNETDVADEEPAQDQSTVFKIDNSLFSIPSPFQTALLINKIEAGYKKDILNNTSNLTTYSTNFKKALNLGVYGADLGYITVYDVPQDAISYLNSVQKLADELGVSSAFDEKTIKRFQNNIGNRDSLLTLISVAYRASDEYLKNNERNDVGALVLTGGWVESLYFSLNVAKTNPHQELLNRIGDQKHTIDNLINLLRRYNDQEDISKLLNKLIDLAYDFDAVEMQYTYEKPEVNRDQKVLHVKSKSAAIVSPELLTKLTEKVTSLRGEIIG
ncbi:MAG: hypothetical protein H6585_09600 [Flavobacteriales bacterium]|nr:hypothetical protein [Flavobacteriales bacterium]MCB9448584.1 hypothetical protein [Flavobacteriales bacterium]